MNNLMNEYLAKILEDFATLSVVLTIDAVIVGVILLYVAFNIAVKHAADRFYERLEARRAQKAWDQFLTDHELRYWERRKK